MVNNDRVDEMVASQREQEEDASTTNGRDADDDDALCEQKTPMAAAVASDAISSGTATPSPTSDEYPYHHHHQLPRLSPTSLYCSLPLNRDVQSIIDTFPKTDGLGGAGAGGDKKTKTRKLPCLYCERTFVADGLRLKHVERCHSVKQARRSSSRFQQVVTPTLPQCMFCSAYQLPDADLQDLFRHLVGEHADRYFACVPCEERFVSKSHLDEHHEEEHGVKSAPDAVMMMIMSDSAIEASKTKLILGSSASSSSSSSGSVSKGRLKDAKLVDVSSNSSTCSSSSRTSSTSGDSHEKMGSSGEQKDALRGKRASLKSTKLGIKRSARLQNKELPQLGKASSLGRKKAKAKQLLAAAVAAASGASTSASTTSIIDAVDVPDRETIKVAPHENPYPTFDAFYRVKKITDHSIDNLRITSLTFNDVFDQAFYTRIKCNIADNLMNHIDGKLFKNEESETRISHFEKQQAEMSHAENHGGYGCEISLNAATPVASGFLAQQAQQLGDDPEAQIEYGSKASKAKKTKPDEVHYKYFTRRKYQASIREIKENRDLSKLDMWTQYVVKNRQQAQRSEKERLEYKKSEEYRGKLQNEELNRILDRRGPFEDLKEEANKQAVADGNAMREARVDVSCILDDVLQSVFALAHSNAAEAALGVKTELTDAVIPDYLNLRKAPVGDESHVDRSDKITLICSSEETENFEAPQVSPRDKHALAELTGEWTRSRLFICAACGLKLANMRALIDHKNSVHQNVWCHHYEFVGKQSAYYSHLSIPGLGKMAHIEEHPVYKNWLRSDARLCSKCQKQCNTLGELHRHILECGEDWSWMLLRKKCKYRPYGARPRRKRRGLIKRHIPHKEKPTDGTEKKTYKREGPRVKPSDAETIQRMLANLPAKRATRPEMSLKDGFPRQSRKKAPGDIKMKKKQQQQQQQQQQPNDATKIVKRKVMVKCNPVGNVRKSMRNLNKVISSALLDNKIMVRRKVKARFANTAAGASGNGGSAELPWQTVNSEEPTEEQRAEEVKKKISLMKKVQNLRKSVIKKRITTVGESEEALRKTRSASTLPVDAPSTSRRSVAKSPVRKKMCKSFGSRLMRGLSLRRKHKEKNEQQQPSNTNETTHANANSPKRKLSFANIKKVVKKLKVGGNSTKTESDVIPAAGGDVNTRTTTTTIAENKPSDASAAPLAPPTAIIIDNNTQAVANDHFLEESNREDAIRTIRDSVISDIDNRPSVIAPLSDTSEKKKLHQNSDSDIVIQQQKDSAPLNLSVKKRTDEVLLLNVPVYKPSMEIIVPRFIPSMQLNIPMPPFPQRSLDTTANSLQIPALSPLPSPTLLPSPTPSSSSTSASLTPSKSKMCKRAKGLNDCIAMLTSKLQCQSDVEQPAEQQVQQHEAAAAVVVTPHDTTTEEQNVVIPEETASLNLECAKEPEVAPPPPTKAETRVTITISDLTTPTPAVVIEHDKENIEMEQKALPASKQSFDINLGKVVDIIKRFEDIDAKEIRNGRLVDGMTMLNQADVINGLTKCKKQSGRKIGASRKAPNKRQPNAPPPIETTTTITERKIGARRSLPQRKAKKDVDAPPPPLYQNKCGIVLAGKVKSSNLSTIVEESTLLEAANMERPTEESQVTTTHATEATTTPLIVHEITPTEKLDAVEMHVKRGASIPTNLQPDDEVDVLENKIIPHIVEHSDSEDELPLATLVKNSTPAMSTTTTLDENKEDAPADKAEILRVAAEEEAAPNANADKPQKKTKAVRKRKSEAQRLEAYFNPIITPIALAPKKDALIQSGSAPEQEKVDAEINVVSEKPLGIQNLDPVTLPIIADECLPTTEEIDSEQSVNLNIAESNNPEEVLKPEMCSAPTVLEKPVKARRSRKVQKPIPEIPKLIIPTPEVAHVPSITPPVLNSPDATTILDIPTIPKISEQTFLGTLLAPAVIPPKNANEEVIDLSMENPKNKVNTPKRNTKKTKRKTPEKVTSNLPLVLAQPTLQLQHFNNPNTNNAFAQNFVFTNAHLLKHRVQNMSNAILGATPILPSCDPSSLLCNEQEAVIPENIVVDVDVILDDDSQSSMPYNCEEDKPQNEPENYYQHMFANQCVLPPPKNRKCQKPADLFGGPNFGAQPTSDLMAQMLYCGKDLSRFSAMPQFPMNNRPETAVNFGNIFIPIENAARKPGLALKFSENKTNNPMVNNIGILPKDCFALNPPPRAHENLPLIPQFPPKVTEQCETPGKPKAIVIEYNSLLEVEETLAKITSAENLRQSALHLAESGRKANTHDEGKCLPIDLTTEEDTRKYLLRNNIASEIQKAVIDSANCKESRDISASPVTEEVSLKEVISSAFIRLFHKTTEKVKVNKIPQDEPVPLPDTMTDKVQNVSVDKPEHEAPTKSEVVLAEPMGEKPMKTPVKSSVRKPMKKVSKDVAIQNITVTSERLEQATNESVNTVPHHQAMLINDTKFDEPAISATTISPKRAPRRKAKSTSVKDPVVLNIEVSAPELTEVPEVKSSVSEETTSLELTPGKRDAEEELHESDVLPTVSIKENEITLLNPEELETNTVKDIKKTRRSRKGKEAELLVAANTPELVEKQNNSRTELLDIQPTEVVDRSAKRGRKSKEIAKGLIEVQANNEVADILLPEVAQSLTPGKKRGRKSKESSNLEKEIIVDAVATKESIPKNAELISDVNAVQMQTLEALVISETIDPVLTPSKKKRGKKNTETESIEETSTFTPPSTTKKRGRKERESANPAIIASALPENPITPEPNAAAEDLLMSEASAEPDAVNSVDKSLPSENVTVEPLLTTDPEIPSEEVGGERNAISFGENTLTEDSEPSIVLSTPPAKPRRSTPSKKKGGKKVKSNSKARRPRKNLKQSPSTSVGALATDAGTETVVLNDTQPPDESLVPELAAENLTSTNDDLCSSVIAEDMMELKSDTNPPELTPEQPLLPTETSFDVSAESIITDEVSTTPKPSRGGRSKRGKKQRSHSQVKIKECPPEALLNDLPAAAPTIDPLPSAPEKQPLSVYDFDEDEDECGGDNSKENMEHQTARSPKRIKRAGAYNKPDSIVESNSESIHEEINNTPLKDVQNESFIKTPDLNDSTLANKLAGRFKVKKGKAGKSKKVIPPVREEMVTEHYCDICNKKFMRLDSLTKHKRTLTHIAKLSEIEALEAEAKKKQKEEEEKENNEDPIVQNDEEIADVDDVKDLGDDTTEKSFDDTTNPALLDVMVQPRPKSPPLAPSNHLAPTEVPKNMLVTSPFSIKTNNDSLKLADIISDVLDKSPVQGMDAEPKRYKSLGERKSFDSDSMVYNPTPSFTSISPASTLITKNDEFLKNQLSLLENIIEENKASFEYMNDDSVQSVASSKSDEPCLSDMSLVSDIKPDESSEIISYAHENHLPSEENFVKPNHQAQYEEISEDSMNNRNYDQERERSRKTLNRDEELFLECCSLLKSSSEVSEYSRKSSRAPPIVNNYNAKNASAKEQQARHWAQHKDAHKNDEEFLSDSCPNTPIGDAYDDYSNSDTIKTDWSTKLSDKEPIKESVESENTFKAFHFKAMDSKSEVDESSNSADFRKNIDAKFGGLMAEALKNKSKEKKNSECKKSKPETLQTTIPDYAVQLTPKSLSDSTDNYTDLTNDSKKMLTKGALKVFEGLKVSIPTDELDMNQVLNCSPTSKRLELEEAAKLSGKHLLFGNKLGMKVTKKRVSRNKKSLPSDDFITDCDKVHDIYDFEETQDNTDLFSPAAKLTFRNGSAKGDDTKPRVNEGKKSITLSADVDIDIQSESESNNIGVVDAEVQSVNSLSTETESSTSIKPTTPTVAAENITKKKCVIMGRIFKNAFKARTEGGSAGKENAPVEEGDPLDSYIIGGPLEEVATPPPEPPVSKERPKMTEKEMDLLFDKLLHGAEQPKAARPPSPTIPEPTENEDETELKDAKMKKPSIPAPRSLKSTKKRTRKHSGSSDDEFNLSKAPKKRQPRKSNKDKDNAINLEQELKECMGVAGRKSQRKCTSGKQNVLIEYWSSDDSDFEAVLKLSMKQDKKHIEASTAITTTTAVVPATIPTSQPEDEPPEVETEVKELLRESHEKVDFNPDEMSIDAPTTAMDDLSSSASLDNTPDTTFKTKRSGSNAKRRSDHQKTARASKPKTPKSKADAASTLAANRRKRAAADTLYYWSSSSEDDTQNLIEVKSVRDEIDDEEDRPQHGWIVGDSPKKLVTLLAHAKGKKTSNR